MIRKSLISAGLALVVFGTAIAATFDGAPTTPLNFNQSSDYLDYDVQIHSRNYDSWETLPLIDAQHGADCSAPYATHPNTSYEGSVYQCANHLMTALNGAAGYGAIYLTPNQLVDFSQGPAVIDFDMSTDRQSNRDWVQFRLTPWAENMATPLQTWLPDLDGEPLHQVMFLMGGSKSFNGEANGVGLDGAWWRYIDDAITPGTNQAATRQHFRITISMTHVKFEMLPSATAQGVVWVDQDVANLGFNQAVFQLETHSYTPDKACNGDGSCGPSTWHWDNVTISPSVPFSIIHTSPRAIIGGPYDGITRTVTFDSPAPAGAYLRFSGICKVTVNGVLASDQPSNGKTDDAGNTKSYFVPIPQGSTSASIKFDADGWYTNWPCQAKDFHVWSLTTSTVPTSTVPNPTATSVAPTATPSLVPATSTPTLTPFPTSIPTLTPTLTPTTSATATPTPRTYRCQVRNPNGSWKTVWTQVGGKSCP